jgi:hypothetical protein
MVNRRLSNILDAHGGMSRWNEYQMVEATIVSGGGLFSLRGVPQDPAVWLHEERCSGRADRRVHDWQPGQLFAPDKECP